MYNYNTSFPFKISVYFWNVIIHMHIYCEDFNFANFQTNLADTENNLKYFHHYFEVKLALSHSENIQCYK